VKQNKWLVAFFGLNHCFIFAVQWNKTRGMSSKTARRIALCLCGQPRFFLRGFYHLKKVLLDQYPGQIDIFAHCWWSNDTIGQSYDVAPWSNISETIKVEPNTIETLKNLYNPVAIAHDKPRNFVQDPSKYKLKSSESAPNNLFSKCTSQFIAVKLKREYEAQHGFTYDLVILTRYDIYFPKKTIALNLNDIDTNIVYNPKDDSHNLVADHFLVCNSANADKIANIVHFLDVYALQDNVKMNAEEQFSHHFTRAQLNLCLLRYPCQINYFRSADLKIGFLSNKLTSRGTEIAMFDYAHFNETLLRNKSIVITRDFNLIRGQYDVSKGAYEKFQKRFAVLHYDPNNCIESLNEICIQQKLDILYVIKSGSPLDKLWSTCCYTLIHAVGNQSSTEHGDQYIVVSECHNQLFHTKFRVLPHLIHVAENPDGQNLRQELNIPLDAIVFGRYGGRETFDLGFVHLVISKIAQDPKYKKIYFLFMNTNPFLDAKLANVIFLDPTDDLFLKRKFIDSCDALLHAREVGESFGLTPGEFSLCEKPTICWKHSRERNHLDFLGKDAIVYENESDLYQILTTFGSVDFNSNFMANRNNNKYLEMTPQKVMGIFQQIIQFQY
jgi:hypothetical protein